MLVICGLQLISDVIVTPRYLHSVTVISGVPSMVKLGGATERPLFLEMNICLHLFVLKFRCLLLIVLASVLDPLISL